MKQILTIYKPLGLTPLQLLDQLRVDRPEFKYEKLSYAGRLDPMAEGLMVVLVGEANNEREKYLKLDKVYEFEMVLGITTDSYDLLGMVESVKDNVRVNEVKLLRVCKKVIGRRELPYPPYSSKTVNGKPLWWWARNSRLDEIEPPMNQVEIYEIELASIHSISAVELLKDIQSKIDNVTGDFRQELILKSWQEWLDGRYTHFPLIQCRVSCSSGTYVRSIVENFGKKLGCGAVTYSIRRTRVGDLDRKINYST